MSKILITGGAGYCGSVLVPSLLNENYEVIVFDTFYFGNYLPKNHKNLSIIKGDIRDVEKFRNSLSEVSTVIHLACISNDASFELDEQLSTSINLNAFEPLVKVSKEAGVSRFIYASSSSVYGVSNADNVTEEHPLVPLTLYNKYKGMCEPILNSYADDDFTVVTFRPATVCGYSPRMRFDLSVNILTNNAISNKNIRVFGGSQLRPNLHISDYISIVKILISAPKKIIQKQIYNVGGENLSILQIAQKVKTVVESEFNLQGAIELSLEDSNDLRSYHINSEKVFRELGFSPSKNVEFAIKELCKKFKDGIFADSLSNDNYYNVKTIKKLGVS